MTRGVLVTPRTWVMRRSRVRSPPRAFSKEPRPLGSGDAVKCPGGDEPVGPARTPVSAGQARRSLAVFSANGVSREQRSACSSRGSEPAPGYRIRHGLPGRRIVVADDYRPLHAEPLVGTTEVVVDTVGYDLSACPSVCHTGLLTVQGNKFDGGRLKQTRRSSRARLSARRCTSTRRCRRGSRRSGRRRTRTCPPGSPNSRTGPVTRRRRR